jgi:uncharacterized protein (DUF2141 family)
MAAMRAVLLGLSGLAISLGAAVAPAQAAGSGLTVQVDGLRNHKGQVCVSLFGSGRGFPDQPGAAVAAQCVAADGDSVLLSFGGLRGGSYAVAVLHDENGDGKANRNALGIPKEGFGFSRNPVLRFGPPSFGDASFVVAGPKVGQQIQVSYF